MRRVFSLRHGQLQLALVNPYFRSCSSRIGDGGKVDTPPPQPSPREDTTVKIAENPLLNKKRGIEVQKPQPVDIASDAASKKRLVKQTQPHDEVRRVPLKKRSDVKSEPTPPEEPSQPTLSDVQAFLVKQRMKVAQEARAEAEIINKAHEAKVQQEEASRALSVVGGNDKPKVIPNYKSKRRSSATTAEYGWDDDASAYKKPSGDVGSHTDGPTKAAPIIKVQRKNPWGLTQLRDQWSEGAMNWFEREGVGSRLEKRMRYHPQEYGRQLMKYLFWVMCITQPCIMGLCYYMISGRSPFDADYRVLWGWAVMDFSPRSKQCDLHDPFLEDVWPRRWPTPDEFEEWAYKRRENWQTIPFCMDPKYKAYLQADNETQRELKKSRVKFMNRASKMMDLPPQEQKLQTFGFG